MNPQLQVGQIVRLKPGETASLTDVTRPACHINISSTDELRVTAVIRHFIKVSLVSNTDFVGSLETSRVNKA